MNRKFFIFLFTLSFTFFCCKNNSHTTKKVNHTENTPSTKKSFVLSCGSGCALTYTEKDIIHDKSKINIVFEVTSYLNEGKNEISEKEVIINLKNSEIESILNKIGNDYEALNKEDNLYLEIIKNYNHLIKNKELNLSDATANVEEIANTKLVGLSVINEKTNDPLKRYGVDFSAACMCDSPSLYVDNKNKELIVYNYCENNNNLNELEHSYKYKIISIEKNENSIVLKTEPLLKLTFTKDTLSTDIYLLEIEGTFSTNYVGNTINSFFTPTPSKFNVADCGDFDG